MKHWTKTMDSTSEDNSIATNADLGRQIPIFVKNLVYACLKLHIALKWHVEH